METKTVLSVIADPNEIVDIEVRFIDLEGKKQKCIVHHNGDQDYWEGYTPTRLKGMTEKSFDINSFNVYQSEYPNQIFINVYQCTTKVGNRWTMDNNKQLGIVSAKVVK